MSKSVKIPVLIDRMSVNNINKLLEFNTEYPNTGQEIFDSLMKESFWINLPYGIVSQLVVILGLNGYSPSDIQPIFDNK